MTDILDDDYQISDARNGYYCEQVGQFSDLDELLTAINDDMQANRFFSNIWFVNDHGNVDLLSVEFQPDGDHAINVIESWV